MNVFTTDHPLVSQTSWFDTKAHPVLSLVCNAFTFAVVLTPFVLVGLCCCAMSDMGGEPEPFPELWMALVLGSVLAFGISLVGAVPIVLAYRLLAPNRVP